MAQGPNAERTSERHQQEHEGEPDAECSCRAGLGSRAVRKSLLFVSGVRGAAGGAHAGSGARSDSGMTALLQREGAGGGGVQLGPSGGCRRGNGGHSGKCSGGGGDGHSDAGEDAGVMVATDVERGGSLRSVQKVRWVGLSDS